MYLVDLLTMQQFEYPEFSRQKASFGQSLLSLAINNRCLEFRQNCEFFSSKYSVYETILALPVALCTVEDTSEIQQIFWSTWIK